MQEYRIKDDLHITAEGAAVLYDEIAIISDLHLGYEESLQKESVIIPRVQLEKIQRKIDAILERRKINTIVINGDLKHDFGSELYQERKEAIALLDYLSEKIDDIFVIRGNHDNFLRTILRKYDIPFHENDIRFGDYLIMHGHTKRASADSSFKIYGHQHPSIKIREEGGAVATMPVFVYHEEEDILILPAFGPLMKGSNILHTKRDYIIPDLEGIDIDDARIFALSGDEILDFKKLAQIKGTINVME